MYREAADAYGAAMERLARAYEADADRRRDLVQEIHIALWRSFATFDQRCSVRTWVYRVSHNAATSYVMRQRRNNAPLVNLEDAGELPDARSGAQAADRNHAVGRMLEFIQRLKPLDRQVILSYLEGLDAAATAEITGISAANVATKIHRIKQILSRQFQEGARHGE
jgi:RNA polymerase sigma-70 factor, ECF subfamily